MLTYQYELIYGASWVAISGSVNADTHHEARAKVFEALQVDDPDPEKWIETNDIGSHPTQSLCGVLPKPARWRVYLTEATEKVYAERVEFWQVPTLFG